MLQQKLIKPGHSLSATAREIGVSLQDLSHYAKAEMSKVGRANRRKIRAWLILEGYLKPPRKPEIWICPLCQAKHVRRKNASQRMPAPSVQGETRR